MVQAREFGFRILQFNAVVEDNLAAIHLYEKIGFRQIGLCAKRFQAKNGEYKDILLYYSEL